VYVSTCKILVVLLLVLTHMYTFVVAKVSVCCIVKAGRNIAQVDFVYTLCLYT
jgi:hypothetical protein